MAKITLGDLATLNNSILTAVNANNALIEAAIENMVSRDGTAPNAMTASLDLNDNDLLNVGTLNATTLRLGGSIAVPTTLTTIQANSIGPTELVDTIGVYQANRTAMKSVDPDDYPTIFLGGTDGGIFVWQTGDYSAAAAKDPDEGILVTSTVTANTAGIWRRVYDQVFPEYFGCKRDGTTDDTTNFQKCVTYCISNLASMHLNGSSGKYLITDTIDFGTDTGVVGFKGLFGNQATILSQVVNAPMFDFVGIQNGVRMPIRDMRIEQFSSDYIADCAFLFARPDTLATSSSGNFIISGNTIYGQYHHAAIYNIQSESNVIWGNFIWNYNTYGHSMALVRFDYFKDLFVLPFDNQTVAFTPALTVTGGTSGATAKIVRAVFDDGGNTGRMWCQKISGTFVDNEALTDSGSGAATTNIPDGYYIRETSPSPNRGIDPTSTSSLQVIQNNFFNNASSTNMDSVVFISDWIDVELSAGNNFNHGATDGTYIHMQQDQTVNAAESTGVAVDIRDNYLHSTHAISIAFGDPASGGGTFENCHIGPQKTTGAVANITGRLQNIGLAGSPCNWISCTVESDFQVNMGDANCQNNCEWRIQDHIYGSFTASGLIEGTLYIDSGNTLSVAGGTNRLTIHYTNLGLSSYPRRLTETISSGAITIDVPLSVVLSESGTSDTLTTLNVLDGVETHGQQIGIKALSGHTITVNESGNIIVPGTSITLDTIQYTFFVKEATSGKWIFAGGHS